MHSYRSRLWLACLTIVLLLSLAPPSTAQAQDSCYYYTSDGVSSAWCTDADGVSSIYKLWDGYTWSLWAAVWYDSAYVYLHYYNEGVQVALGSNSVYIDTGSGWSQVCGPAIGNYGGIFCPYTSADHTSWTMSPTGNSDFVNSIWSIWVQPNRAYPHQ